MGEGMSRLRREWENYNDAESKWWQVVLVVLSITEDFYRCVGLPNQWLMPLWKLRGYVSRGRHRRLLRRAVKHWAKTGYYSQDLFDFGDRALSVTFEWKDIRMMRGYQNDIQ